MQEGHDVAQVCLNGHKANASFNRLPQFNKPFCDECGDRTITACPGCNASIRGHYWGGSVGFGYDVPQHCHQCGAAYPWMVRRKAAALELFVEMLDIENEQREELKLNLDAIATENPRTQVAALKIKRLIGKAGKEAAGMLRDVMVDLVSETAKKVIWPGSP